MRSTRVAAAVAVAVAAACGAPGDGADEVATVGDEVAAPDTPAAQRGPVDVALVETVWRLVEFQSMDDAIGTTRTEDPSLYTLRLHADGTLDMRLNCNRATGAWTAEPGPEGDSGALALGPLAVTRALCPPPSLDEQIARHAEYVRTYLLRDGRLHLGLLADGGIYVWEPQRVVPETKIPDPEGAAERGN